MLGGKSIILSCILDVSCMSTLGLFTAVVMFVLTNVFAGMLPVTFTGDAQLAVWLIAVVVAVASYITVEQAMAGVK